MDNFDAQRNTFKILAAVVCVYFLKSLRNSESTKKENGVAQQ